MRGAHAARGRPLTPAARLCVPEATPHAPPTVPSAAFRLLPAAAAEQPVAGGACPQSCLDPRTAAGRLAGTRAADGALGRP